MPYIKIQVTDEGVTREQKQQHGTCAEAQVATWALMQAC